MSSRVRFYVGLASAVEGYTPELIEARALAEMDAREPGFTVYRAEGRWEGKPEPCLVLEVLTDRPPEGLVAVGPLLARACGQSAVLVTVETVNATLAEPGNGLQTV